MLEDFQSSIQEISYLEEQLYTNNNNLILDLILGLQPRQTWNCVWDPLVCVTSDLPLRSNLTAKIYRGVHTLPPSGFDPALWFT